MCLARSKEKGVLEEAAPVVVRIRDAILVSIYYGLRDI